MRKEDRPSGGHLSGPAFLHVASRSQRFRSDSRRVGGSRFPRAGSRFSAELSRVLPVLQLPVAFGSCALLTVHVALRESEHLASVCCSILNPNRMPRLPASVCCSCVLVSIKCHWGSEVSTLTRSLAVANAQGLVGCTESVTVASPILWPVASGVSCSFSALHAACCLRP